jgi:hypothetical protein
MNTSPNTPKRQPKTINFNGEKFILHVPFRVVNEEAGVCEGPLYRRPGYGTDRLYMPDAAYLYAGQKLGFMHRIVFTGIM